MANKEIKVAMINAGVHQWRVAQALGLHENSFSRKLRYELSETEREKILEVIKEISQEES